MVREYSSKLRALAFKLNVVNEDILATEYNQSASRLENPIRSGISF
jgi:hypothetical protein